MSPARSSQRSGQHLGQRISTHGSSLLREAEPRRVENSGGAKCAAGRPLASLLRGAFVGSAGRTHHMWHTAAAALALLGKPAPAIELLEKAGGFGLPNYELFRDDKFLKPLKGKQRYDRLLPKLKREDQGYRREFAPAS